MGCPPADLPPPARLLSIVAFVKKSNLVTKQNFVHDRDSSKTSGSTVPGDRKATVLKLNYWMNPPYNIETFLNFPDQYLIHS